MICTCKKAVTVLPNTEKILATMGEQIKSARLRRQLSAELVAEDDEFGRKMRDLNMTVKKERLKEVKNGTKNIGI